MAKNKKTCKVTGKKNQTAKRNLIKRKGRNNPVDVKSRRTA